MSYDTDVYEWTREQAGALRRRAANKLDWDNLAEEIESLGSGDRRQIKSRLEILILHLLKWKYQPEWQCGSWRGLILEARHRLEDLLEEVRRCARFLPNICRRPSRGRAKRRSPRPVFIAFPRPLRGRSSRSWTRIFCLDPTFVRICGFLQSRFGLAARLKPYPPSRCANWR